VLTALIIHADLTAFRLDPETTRRDAARAETRESVAVRRANASRTQIGKAEVNGGLHRKSFRSFLCGSLRIAARVWRAIRR
jgi:hypothetical protein